MDLLKKTIAPITDNAWKEISDQIQETLNAYRTGRKFVDINGPNGIELGGIPTGRLNVSDDAPFGVNYGIREFLPLLELRKPFELDVWELDNVERGAKNINLEPLEEAVKQMVEFEENAIYYGFESAGIKGMENVSEHETVILPNDVNAFLKEVGQQVITLQNSSVEGPYTLVLKEEHWLKLVKLSEGYPALKQLGEILGGQVLVNHYNSNSFLVTERGGDFELVIGRDLAVGYDHHDSRTVKLFLTCSFTFQVYTPEAIVVFGDKN